MAGNLLGFQTLHIFYQIIAVSALSFLETKSVSFIDETVERVLNLARIMLS